jgi:hypothetical protein
VFQYLSQLAVLDRSANTHLMLPLPLDLSCLMSLTYLNLSDVLSVTSAFRRPCGSPLRILDLTSTTRMSSFYDTPVLEELDLDQTITFLNLQDLTLLTNLRVFSACHAPLTTGSPFAFDGHITQQVFANLAFTNPVLEVLAIGNNALNFAVSNETDDFPVINSPSSKIKRAKSCMRRIDRVQDRRCVTQAAGLSSMQVNLLQLRTRRRYRQLMAYMNNHKFN